MKLCNIGYTTHYWVIVGNRYRNHNSNQQERNHLQSDPFVIPSFVEILSTPPIVHEPPKNAYNSVVVDRYALSKTWWLLLQKLAGRAPNVIDQALIDLAYKKIKTAMAQKTDEELMQDMQDIVDAVDFARIKLPGLKPKVGYFKK